MEPEKAIWIWPKSGTYTLIQFLLLLLGIYILLKIISHYSRRSENAKRNWYRLHHMATRRGLRLSERRVLYHFFHQLTLSHRENLFHSKTSLHRQLFHFLANLEGEESSKYLELLGKLEKEKKSSLRKREDFRGLLDIDSDEIVAFRVRKYSGLATVSEKLDGQILLSVKGKKYKSLPNQSHMEAHIYRSGIGLLSLSGKAQKISHNSLLFSAK
jgi:hypothetical protein